MSVAIPFYCVIFDKHRVMEDVRFSSAEANLVVHSTEDQERILKSVEETLLLTSDRFSSTPSEGHYKNKILMLKAVLSSNEANDLASRIATSLNSTDRQAMLRGIEQFSDEKGNLYLRLDKQRLCQGKISISSADSIRIKFKPVKRYTPTSNLQTYRGLFTSE
jgi:RNA-binding protein